jgi:cysteine sulfinate desulfinase/cysteine desulfurase-like protein
MSLTQASRSWTAVVRVNVRPSYIGWLQQIAAGRVYDVAAVGRVTRRHGVPFLLDACQSVGQVSCTLGPTYLPSAQQQSKSAAMWPSCDGGGSL